jgi:hypothetical protein
MKKWLLGLIIFVVILILFFIEQMISPPSPLLSPGCSDSDGGRDFYTKGILTILEQLSQKSTPATFHSESSGMQHLKGPRLSPFTQTYEDLCVDSKNVKEYFCSGDSYATQNHFCPNGCEDGACIKGREPFCSKMGTVEEGWYQENDVLIQLGQCDGDYSMCKTPGFSGQTLGGIS